jgi:Uncharacterized conserved protein
MPTQWTLDLALTTDLAEQYRYDVIHALACRFFEQPDADHEAEHKPFAARLGPASATGSVLTLAWLRDDPPPAAAVPTSLRLGPHHVEVTAFRTDKRPHARLGTQPHTGRIRYQTLSPTKFRHHGNDYLLPDPYLTYSGLVRRYRLVNPSAVSDELARDLPRSVIVHHHDIHTEPVTWHGHPTVGFVGTVTFGLSRTCSREGRQLFAKLNDFAAIAGIGHGTTHGLGAVETCPEPTLRQPPAENQEADD